MPTVAEGSLDEFERLMKSVGESERREADPDIGSAGVPAPAIQGRNSLSKEPDESE